jgi:hypothetical protein
MNDFDLWPLIVWSGYAAIGLLILAVIGYFVYWIVAKVNNLKDGMDVVHGQLHNRLRSLEDGAGRPAAKLQDEIAVLKKSVREFRDRLDELEHLLESPPTIATAGRFSGDVSELENGLEDGYAPAEPHPPIFPANAEDFIARFGPPRSIEAKSEVVEGVLVRPGPGEKGEFLVLAAPDREDGWFYAVPNRERFQTKSEFHTYYSKYYDCQNPSSGNVMINLPAVLTYTEQGWKLATKGELETR